MKTFLFIISLFMVLPVNLFAQKDTLSRDSLRFSGQVVFWGIGNYNKAFHGEIGLRFIPQLNYGIQMGKKNLLDWECSFNTYAGGSFDSLETNPLSLPIKGAIKPYRAWIRYSNEQLEIRAGLQKINFGTARILRPLMWFDGVDARDPLGFTNGVYALLVRYYFLNNTNIWVWGLYGNQNTKGWEWANTTDKTPEFGGRIQMPIKKNSEVGISYHHRNADLSLINPDYTKKEENRVGFDYRIDWLLGSWIEASGCNYQVDSLSLQIATGEITYLKNQESITIGSDYTFDIGNGLLTTLEHLVIAQDDIAFSFDKISQVTALSFSYPAGMFDNLHTFFYYDWTNHKLYNFINWQHDFPKFTFYTMAYWNPKEIQLSRIMGTSSNNELFAGKGIQLMIVYNF